MHSYQQLAWPELSAIALPCWKDAPVLSRVHQLVLPECTQLRGSHDEGLLCIAWVQVWDTNSLVAVCNFGLPDRVYALDMSEVAAVHCLIAVGNAEPQARHA